MKTITLKDEPGLLNVVRKVAPNYRKHKAIVSESDSFENHGSFWDGGSRSSSYLVTNIGASPVHGPTAPSQFGGGGSVTIPVLKGQHIVTVGTFRGKTATVSIVIGTGDTE